MTDWDSKQAYATVRRFLLAFLGSGADERRAIVATLRPSTAELAQLFVPEVVESVAIGYERLWGNTPLWPAKADQTEVEVEVVRVRDFHATQLHLFPNEYRLVAPYLAADGAWAAWRFFAPRHSGRTRYDGLVLIGDTLRWCPRPWKVLPQRILPPHLRALWGE